MPKPKTATGEKNLISKRLIELREKNHMSQRMLAHQLQLRGYDMDKNVITRIETNKRFVTDVEIKAFSEVFEISYEYLIDGKEKLCEWLRITFLFSHIHSKISVLIKSSRTSVRLGA